MKHVSLLLALILVTLSSHTVRAETQSINLDTEQSSVAEVPADVLDFMDAQVVTGNWNESEAATALTAYKQYREQLAGETVLGAGPFPIKFPGFGRRRGNMHFRKGHHALKCPNGRCR